MDPIILVDLIQVSGYNESYWIQSISWIKSKLIDLNSQSMQSSLSNKLSDRPNIQFSLFLCSIVVEHSTHNPRIKGSCSDTATGKDTFSKKNFFLSFFILIGATMPHKIEQSLEANFPSHGRD